MLMHSSPRSRPLHARLLAAALLLVLASVLPALGDDVITPPPMPVPLEPEPLGDAPPNPDGPVFAVSNFVLVYGEAHPDLPPLDDLLPIEVLLGRLESGLVNTKEGIPSEVVTLDGAAREPRLFHASAIGSIGRQLLPVFHERGLAGVFVAPHEDDIDIANERDLRLAHDRVLRLVVNVARVREVRTVGSGDRVHEEWRIDNRVHRQIRLHSPLQPPGTGIEGTTDLLNKDLLEDYLHRLNRHPGRRVEAALAPSTDGEGIALDYRVVESKPWYAYYQASNTGTEQTAEWQHRFGVVHRQLTNHDDIFTLEYLNAGLDRVHGVSGSYEAPWFEKRRPSWLRNTTTVPNALSWIPRDKIPWWGSDRLRWQLHGYWNQFKAENVGNTDDFEGRQYGGGGRLIYNAFQHEALFVDLMVGFKVRDIEVMNPTVGSTAQEFFMLPELGLELERFNEFSAMTANVSWEHNAGGTRDDTLGLLGRSNPDGDWHVIKWDAGIAHYLEPLIFNKAWRNPNTPLTSTLAHEVSAGTRGQYAFDYRLVPQVGQVIGGLYSVRGYPNSIGTGDNVYIGTFEYRFHVPQAFPIRREPVQLPVLGDFRAAPQTVYGRADWDFIIRAFVDGGKTERNDRSRALGPEPDLTLLGAGVGAELRLGSHIRARVDWGRALKSTRSATTRVKKGNDEVYFLFSVLY
jgi:hypothetical protein